jgi:spore coat polysaccharide biosynthesis protein SpsF (cytidylyltransferase family)
MQTFYEGWQIVQAFIESDARLPKEVMLPLPAHREVARMLEARRDFFVLDVVQAIRPFGQPELIETSNKDVALETLKGETHTNLVVAPLSRTLFD